MRVLLFVMLVRYAVRCDDSSYYVVEIPEEPTRSHKPFKVYWNVPTMQCSSKKIPFTKLFEKYGIIQNANDSFRGEKIAILYDPGLFPALFKNENGSYKFRNGGVPQEGDLQTHLAAFKETMEQSIPDPGFEGVGIIDFESWRPVFRQNFGVLAPYKDISYQIERKYHWFWPEKAVQARARQRFEDSAREFMQATLSLARRMRPRALWGYYAYPYCFNMAPNNMLERCASGVPRENDDISWLWSGSSALYPSVYSAGDGRAGRLAALVRGRLREAARLRAPGAPILPYFWYRHRDGTYLSQDELNTVFSTLYNSNASGFIIWGSSNDVNTVEKCKKLHQYTEQILGPSVFKYTKRTQSSDTTTNPTDNGTTTLKSLLTEQIKNKTTEEADVNIHGTWEAPENYSQDIQQQIENNEKNQNESKYNAEQEYLSIQKKTFLEMLFNMLTNERETENEYLINAENVKVNESVTEDILTVTTTDLSNINVRNIETSSVTIDTMTSNSLEQLLEDMDYNNNATVEPPTIGTNNYTRQTSQSPVTAYPINDNTSNILKLNEKLNNNSHYYFIFNNNIIEKPLNDTENLTLNLQAANLTQNFSIQSEKSNLLLNESSQRNYNNTENSKSEDTIITTDDTIFLTSTDILVTNTEPTHQIKDEYELSSTIENYELDSTNLITELLHEDTNIQIEESSSSTQSDIETTTELPPKMRNNLQDNNINGNIYNGIVSLVINITEFLSSGFTNIQDTDKMIRVDDYVEPNVNTVTTDAPIVAQESSIPDKRGEDYEDNAVTDETSTNSVRQVVALF